jgi:imidazolonepropionase-like amidohydrolase
VKNTSRALLLVLLVLFVLPGVGDAAPPNSVIILHDVTIIDPSAKSIRPHMSILLDGGRIKQVLPSRNLKRIRTAKVLKLSGRYVLPGFIDMHVHVLGSPRAESGEILPKPDAVTTRRLLAGVLAAGVTTVRDPGAPTTAAVELRDQVERRAIVGPRIITAGSILNLNAVGPEFVSVKTEAEVCAEVERQKAAGVDLVKVYSGLRPGMIAAAIGCAHKAGLKIIGHVFDWTEAANLHIDGLEHAAPWSPQYLAPDRREGGPSGMFARVYWLKNLELDSAPVRVLVAALVRNRVTVDPTLIAMHTKFWGDDPAYTHSDDLALAPPQYVRGWKNGSFTASWGPAEYEAAKLQWGKLASFVKLLFDQGVLLTTGTDTPTPWIVPGVSLHQEMKLLHEAGIPTMDVLRMATFNAAVVLGKDQEFGRVRPGMAADLVVLNGNPVTDISNTRRIEFVIQAGTVFTPRDLRAAAFGNQN